jgi:hypothetical protein
MTHRRHVASTAAAILVLAGAAAAAKSAPDHGLRFDSPGVLDLAQRPLKNAPQKALSIDVLESSIAAAIVAAPAIGADSPQLKFSEDEFGCKDGARQCAQTHEAKLLAAADGTVKRLGQRLVIAAAAGQPAVFVDWTQAETKSADGDSETHWYLGRMAGNGYQRVEVQFGHDAPGDFLINPRSGKMAFVHNGADLAAPSPDGLRLVTANAENPPLSVRVASLDAAGPRLELVCAAREHDERSATVFKGWKDANTFDLVVDTGIDGAKKSIALRATRSGNAWHLAAGDPGALSAAGIACMTP